MEAVENQLYMLGRSQRVLESTLKWISATAKVNQWQNWTIDAHFPWSTSQWDWRFKTGTSLLIVLLLTYLTTCLKSSFAIRRKKVGREPPIMPYWTPFLGNLVAFLWDPPGFCYRATEQFGYSIPVRVRLGPFQIFLVSAADHYAALFNNKASRSLGTKAGVLLALKNLFGTPADVIPFYAADSSGVNSVPLPGSKVKPEHRITYFQTRAAHRHLSGPGLVQMTERFLEVLQRRIYDSQIGAEWVEWPDLYFFLQVEVFNAAVEAMCGSYLLSQHLTFVEDFWEFVRSIPTLVNGLPRWISPKPYQVRDRLLNAIKRWHKLAHEHSDCTKTGAEDPEWEPYFGSKLMRARQEYSQGMDFMNADALAAEDLGLIFATNTNAIPSVTWFIFEICRDPSLLSRVRKEVEESSISFPETGQAGFDVGKLCSQPLLQSVYAETLRLRVAVIVTRTPEREAFTLGEWTFPPKKVIALSSRTAAMNPNVWNAGSPEDPHPLHTFWAERFLIFPDDPTSGPLRKEHAAEKQHRPELTLAEQPETGPQFSMDGVAGGWIPYGGGQRMCPGRHFAKQEIIGTFATLFTHYDIELLIPKDDKPERDMRFFPFGGLPPKRKISFRIRQRKT